MIAAASMLLLATTLGIADELKLPTQEAVLADLRAGHPRLLATAESFTDVRGVCATNATAKRWLEHLTAEADELLSAPPVKYEIPDGKRLLSVSRRAKDRLLLLGLVYRLTGERRWADRAWDELAAVTAFKDWNPSHFLDTAEMTFAVSIGYDWLYDAWSDEQRAALRSAIVRMGLKPGLKIYRKNEWWAKSGHNWNQVCNGGMAVGALAIADEEREVSAEVLHSALHSLPLAMRNFAPDGGWGEGPGYWRYATEYNVYLLAALDSALATDFGLSRMDGFSRCGDFPIYLLGPTGKTFNFADAHDGWGGAPQLFWLASRFEQPGYAAAQMSYADERHGALDLLWGVGSLSDGGPTKPLPTKPLPTARQFRGVEVVSMRTAWDDADATFVALKGGDNRVNHGHLDLGSFIFEARGQRWAIDLGSDDYNLPGYFGRQRWSYLRNNTQSHNTIVLDGHNQSPSAKAKIVRFAGGEGRGSAVVDLTAAWPQAKRVERGVALVNERQTVVQDEIEADRPVAAVWQVLTDAEVTIEGRKATFRKAKRRIAAMLVEPADASWHVGDVTAPPPQRPLKNVRKLSATLAEPASNTRFVVCFDVSDDPQPPPAVRPLAQWPDESHKSDRP